MYRFLLKTHRKNFSYCYLALIYIICLNSVLIAQDNQPVNLKIGDPAPLFVLKSLDDDRVFLRDYCGELRQPWKNKTKHVVLVSFFATWCKPCHKEIYELQETIKKYKGVFESPSPLRIAAVPLNPKKKINPEI